MNNVLIKHLENLGWTEQFYHDQKAGEFVKSSVVSFYEKTLS